MKWNLNIQMQIAFVVFSVFFFENSFAFVVVFFSTDFSLKIITANMDSGNNCHTHLKYKKKKKLNIAICK